jgi:hypothetical protein
LIPVPPLPGHLKTGRPIFLAARGEPFLPPIDIVHGYTWCNRRPILGGPSPRSIRRFRCGRRRRRGGGGHIPLAALDPATTHQLAEHSRRVATALIDVAVLSLAGLVSLRCINIPEPDPLVRYVASSMAIRMMSPMIIGREAGGWCSDLPARRGPAEWCSGQRRPGDVCRSAARRWDVFRF